MKPADVFQQIPFMTTEEVRKFIKEKDALEYNLVDVRQPVEYEEHHLPGAKLLPLGELANRMREIDPSRPTIVYCRSGNRSGAATTLLLSGGLQNVFNMEGGIRAWNGFVSSGQPEAGMVYFTAAARPVELIALAWALEEGSLRFYGAIAASLQDSEAARLFESQVSAEEHHKSALLGLYRELSGKRGSLEIPASLFSGTEPGTVMEGGVSVLKALEWSKGKGANDILDLAIGLESNAYDLYLKMERLMEDERTRRVFRLLAGEEQAHLEAMTALLEKRRFPNDETGS
jgi:rhodanese-related sulfurtransferase/rubrerythrin